MTTTLTPAQQPEQVVHSPTGDVSRPLPADILEEWEGLRDFLKVEVTNAAGRVVSRRSADVCLNAFERERVNDEGPINPTYPVFCFANPFTKGMVWGIDEGWASNPFDFFGGPRMRVRDGTYTVTYRIAARYQELFGVSPGDGRATVTLTVDTREGACTRCGRRGAQRLAEQFQEPIQSQAVPEESDPPPSILPDLRALPSWGIGVTSRRGRDFLAFGSTVWVAGASPLVIEGFRREDSDVMDAFQYFYQDGEPVARAPVGELEFDIRRGHDHWHFKQFAGYRLLDSDKAVQVRSRKESFCLASTDAIDLALPHAEWTPEQLGLETACGFSESIWVRETLPVGWGRHLFPVRPRTVVRHHRASERHLLHRGHGQPDRAAARAERGQQHASPKGDPSRTAGGAQGQSPGVAGNRFGRRWRGLLLSGPPLIGRHRGARSLALASAPMSSGPSN